MAVEIAKLYNRGGVGLLEAGTGVGKSLGYLVKGVYNLGNLNCLVAKLRSDGFDFVKCDGKRHVIASLLGHA